MFFLCGLSASVFRASDAEDDDVFTRIRYVQPK
jgi:hypothetical protein